MLTTNPFDDDKLKEECAVFGIWGTKDAAAHTALGLHAQQHRGQEACGIVCNNGDEFNAHRALGQVGDVFGDHRVMERLEGKAAIGHTRYSTTGEPNLRNVQPVYADFAFGGLALAHNGNLTNAISLRNELVQTGSIFQSTTDTEVLIHLIATSKGKVRDRLITALRLIEGAYSVVLLTRKKLIGVRDPRGVRPLVLGKLGDAYMFASETVALDIIGAEFIREVEPGEMITVDENGLTSEFPLDKTDSRFCIFEYVYFSRPDSIIEGRSVYDARKHIGKELAMEFPVEADVVIPIPDSGVPSALGYAEESGIPFELGIIRNHYIGRTFIEPTDEIRHLGVKLKHNANRGHIEGKRVVLVDDSIVRGTTSRKIVEMVRDAGAKEVHMRISSPPTSHSCFYGVDTPERKSLLASSNTIEQMRELIGADSLAFVTMDGMYRAMGEDSRNNEAPQYCDACFSGDYPIALVDKENKGTGQQLTNLREQRR
ncbi:amidophosphoribosyltransferase [Curvivirga aplysinae]|uniref:amidophosphoribosyltransferase n=1 Tax=Curvivirga aplysinae TaxID=2529852 RepID=UPI0012BB6074|nr:amidophosphoribosyltransferase [Curvivirga aplysinae]MTI10027.1 amidophosphoribosyltransferase [Curvivirga aplysinae]